MKKIAESARYVSLTAGFLLLVQAVVSQDLGAIKQQKPVTMHGNIGLNLMAYTADGIESRQDPFSYVFSANAALSIYGVNLPFSFVYSNKQRSYNQPFNQFGISPHYKWITLHAGYRNVSWSSFTLAGHTFLGGGLELNPGRFRFGAIYGRFDRKTNGNIYNSSDPLPVYARRGMAFKIGVGTDKNYFDLMLLRIRDDSTSVRQPDTGLIRTPNHNVVAGFKSRFTILKKLSWENEAAISLFTANIGARSIEEIDSNRFLNSTNKFLGVNQSSEYSTAIRSQLHYKGKGFSLKLEYKRIAPGYKSFGAYFFNNDLQNLTFSPSFGLFKRKVSVSGSIGLQSDNLRKIKRATTRRTIGMLNISVNPSQKFGIDLGYNYYSLNQKSGNIPLVDSIKVHQANHSIILTPRLMFIRKTLSHLFVLNYNNTFMDDKNPHTSEAGEYTLHSAFLNYTLTLTGSQWSFNSGVNWSRFHNFSGNNTGTGATLGISKNILDGRLSLGWNNAYTHTEYPGGDGWTFNSNIASLFNITKHHSLKINIYYTKNQVKAANLSHAFNELKGDLSYVFTF